MKNLEIYIVMSSIGKYEDYRTNIEGIFYTKKDAENFQIKFHTDIKNILNKGRYLDEDELPDNISIEEFNEFDKSLDKAWNFNKTYIITKYVSSFNG